MKKRNTALSHVRLKAALNAPGAALCRGELNVYHWSPDYVRVAEHELKISRQRNRHHG